MLMRMVTGRQAASARIRAGITTQRRLSELTGISIRTINKWENEQGPVSRTSEAKLRPVLGRYLDTEGDSRAILDEIHESRTGVGMLDEREIDGILMPYSMLSADERAEARRLVVDIVEKRIDRLEGQIYALKEINERYQDLLTPSDPEASGFKASRAKGRNGAGVSDENVSKLGQLSEDLRARRKSLTESDNPSRDVAEGTKRVD